MSEPTFSHQELFDAFNALESLFQNHEWPGGDSITGEDRLVEELHEKGITRALTRRLVDDLIEAGLFTSVDTFRNFTNFVPLSGGEQVTTASGQFRRLRTSKALWFSEARNALTFLCPIARIPSPADTDTDSPQYVTLDQMAAMVSRSKRTVEKLIVRDSNPLLDPDIQGGGGKPNEWNWERIRPWLETEYGRKLPTVFPVR